MNWKTFLRNLSKGSNMLPLNLLTSHHRQKGLERVVCLHLITTVPFTERLLIFTERNGTKQQYPLMPLVKPWIAVSQHFWQNRIREHIPAWLQHRLSANWRRSCPSDNLNCVQNYVSTQLVRLKLRKQGNTSPMYGGEDLMDVVLMLKYIPKFLQ